MKRSIAFSLFFAVAVCALAGFFSGCETTEGDTTGLTVSPSTYTSTNRSELIVFEVGSGTNTFTNMIANSGLRDLSLPLEWSLGNPSLGYIAAQSGYSCTYARGRADGIQTITVRDQYGAEGQATVDQQ